jgi:Tol biopolymer transport system component
MSADGRFVVFASPATNLVAGLVDAGATSDVFLHDREAGTTTLISRTASSAATTGNGFSESPVISADGTVVLFTSLAADLFPGDHNGLSDVFAFGRCPAQSSRALGASCRRVPAGPGRSAPARGAPGSASR